jgi:hypothetical protein
MRLRLSASVGSTATGSRPVSCHSAKMIRGTIKTPWARSVKMVQRHLCRPSRSEEAQAVTCVPTLLHMLLSHRAAADVDLRGWKVVIGGSALSKGRSGGLAFAPFPNPAPRKDGLIL